jgi:hypothetical protein
MGPPSIFSPFATWPAVNNYSGCQLSRTPPNRSSRAWPHSSSATVRRWCSKTTTARTSPPLPCKHCCETSVETLFSPPYWPRFNGSIEAGIHSLKDRTDACAARAGRPAYWTADDIAAAFHDANTWARPFGATGPSPQEVWNGREPISETERVAFTECVRFHLASENFRAAPCETEWDGVLSTREMARNAIPLALEERGYLKYRRRLIPQPLIRQKAARIT